MLNRMFSALKIGPVNDSVRSQRKHERRACDKCVATVSGQNVPVVDWSPGGTLLAADDRMFSVGQNIPVTLKFRLQNEILNIPHIGNIIRKSAGKIAVQFEPLPQAVRYGFQRVIDDYTAREFADSQRF